MSVFFLLQLPEWQGQWAATMANVHNEPHGCEGLLSVLFSAAALDTNRISCALPKIKNTVYLSNFLYIFLVWFLNNLPGLTCSPPCVWADTTLGTLVPLAFSLSLFGYSLACLQSTVVPATTSLIIFISATIHTVPGILRPALSDLFLLGLTWNLSDKITDECRFDQI